MYKRQGLATDGASVEAELTFGAGGGSRTITVAPEPAALQGAVAEAPAGSRLDRVAVRGTVSMPRFDPSTVAGDGRRAEATGSRTVQGDEAALYRWSALEPGAVIEGPAVLEEDANTCTVPAGWQLRADEFTNGVLERRA